MEDRKQLRAERKAQKKAYKKARRKYTQPWKILSVIMAISALLIQLVGVIAGMADNTFAIITGEKFWTLENEDPNAVYYKGDYATTEERLAAGADVVYQTEAEAATLLMNESNALPLAAGNKISLFSTSSVNVVYGGTGSANVDSSTCDNLKQAAEKAGLVVNETLWNFYTEGEGSEYVRVTGDMWPWSPTTAIGEAPWSAYTEEVKASFTEYGDAAVVVLSRVGGEDDDLQFQTYN